MQRSSFFYKLFTNIVTRFVTAIQNFYVYLFDRNFLEPYCFSSNPIFFMKTFLEES